MIERECAYCGYFSQTFKEALEHLRDKHPFTFEKMMEDYREVRAEMFPEARS